MEWNKKGQLGGGWANSLIYGAGALVVAGVFMALGAQVTTNVQSGFTANTLPYNITRQSLEGVNNLSTNQGTIGTIVAFSVIIGLLVGAFAYFMGRQ